MANKKEKGCEIEQGILQRAILLELENVAVKGRQIVYDVLKSVLADKGIDLTSMAFSRYCLYPSVKYFLPALLAAEEKKRLSKDKLLAEITQGITLSLTDDSVKLEAGLADVLKIAKEKKVLVGVLSGLGEKTARQLLAKLGLTDMGVHLLPYSCEDKNFPSADAWLKLAKIMSVLPALCLVIATSATACKAALSAGMRCVVVPDRFTTFQDFGGADHIAEDLDKTTVKTIFALLKFC